jgi:hypothetical protein
MDIKPGDILGFRSPGWVSKVICLGTFGDIAHVGIVARHGGKLLLFESTTLAADGAPCCLQNKKIKGVQAHPLDEALKRRAAIYHYPLVKPLSEQQTRKLTIYLTCQLGKKYDYRGAIGSGGGIMLRILRCFLKKASFTDIFCSELCAGGYDYLEILPSRNASAYNPVAFLRRARRYGIHELRKRIPNAS